MKRTPEEWAKRKGIPSWQLAVASAVANWFPGAQISESDFDAATKQAEDHVAEHPPKATK